MVNIHCFYESGLFHYESGEVQNSARNIDLHIYKYFPDAYWEDNPIGYTLGEALTESINYIFESQ